MGVFERIKESDHEWMVDDLEEEAAEGGAITDDAADDVSDGDLIEVDPETLVVEDELKGPESESE